MKTPAETAVQLLRNIVENANTPRRSFAGRIVPADDISAARLWLSSAEAKQLEEVMKNDRRRHEDPRLEPPVIPSDPASRAILVRAESALRSLLNHPMINPAICRDEIHTLNDLRAYIHGLAPQELDVREHRAQIGDPRL